MIFDNQGLITLSKALRSRSLFTAGLAAKAIRYLDFLSLCFSTCVFYFCDSDFSFVIFSVIGDSESLRMEIAKMSMPDLVALLACKNVLVATQAIEAIEVLLSGNEVFFLFFFLLISFSFFFFVFLSLTRFIIVLHFLLL